MGVKRQPDFKVFRWDILLPTVAAAVAVMLIGLAGLTTYAFKQREAFALDGRVFGLAHHVESLLREVVPGDEQDVLDATWQEDHRPVIGLILKDGLGQSQAAVGVTGSDIKPREVGLFVGPTGGPRGRPWGSDSSKGVGQPFGRRGRRTLEVFLKPGTGNPPLPIRLLLPFSIGVGLGLFALAVLGGRLLIRQQYEAEAHADRRRMQALGRAGAGLAHQLRNPLATIKGSAQLLEEGLDEEAFRNRAGTIVAQADRMDRMLGTLLDFARPPTPEVSIVQLHQCLEELTRNVDRTTLDVPVSTTVEVDPVHLGHIVENVLSNALAHSPGDSVVEISGRTKGVTVEILISDRGQGPGDDPEELFQPYVTHRPDGAGLGLTIARTLAEANGGRLMLRGRQGGGTTAVLALPSGDHGP